MYRLFLEGGYVGMSALTILLIGLFFAAWKAPAWVRESGLLALIGGIFYQLIGVYQMCGILWDEGSISPGILAAGFKVSLISTMYGMLIYVVSLVIRMVQKPKI